MPIPMEAMDLRENEQPSDFILTQIRTVLEYGDEETPRIDETIMDVSLG